VASATLNQFQVSLSPRVSRKEVEGQEANDSESIRIAAEAEGKRVARLGFEARGNKSSVLLTERMLWSYIALGFQAGARFQKKLLSEGCPAADRDRRGGPPTQFRRAERHTKVGHSREVNLRCALYARLPIRLLTSDRWARDFTKDKDREVRKQLRQLREFSAQRGWIIVAEYIQEHEFGRVLSHKKFHAMYEAAESREFDVVVFWSLDRISRERDEVSIQYLQLEELLSAGWRSNQVKRAIPKLYRAVFE